MTMDVQAFNLTLFNRVNDMSIVTSAAFICTICGGVIGYIIGYRHGHTDTEKAYKDVYDIKDWS